MDMEDVVHRWPSFYPVQAKEGQPRLGRSHHDVVVASSRYHHYANFIHSLTSLTIR